jgi:hypothetical protein
MGETLSDFPHGHRQANGFCLARIPLLIEMPLLPRWRFMTDEAKALAKRTAISAGVVVLALLVFRALLPWLLLALAAYWIWKLVSK